MDRSRRFRALQSLLVGAVAGGVILERNGVAVAAVTAVIVGCIAFAVGRVVDWFLRRHRRRVSDVPADLGDFR
jgi:hypothetical protein